MYEVLKKRASEMADIASGIDTLSLQKLLSACPDLRIICHILYIQSFGN